MSAPKSEHSDHRLELLYFFLKLLIFRLKFLSLFFTLGYAFGLAISYDLDYTIGFTLLKFVLENRLHIFI